MFIKKTIPIASYLFSDVDVERLEFYMINGLMIHTS